MGLCVSKNADFVVDSSTKCTTSNTLVTDKGSPRKRDETKAQVISDFADKELERLQKNVDSVSNNLQLISRSGDEEKHSTDFSNCYDTVRNLSDEVVSDLSPKTFSPQPATDILPKNNKRDTERAVLDTVPETVIDDRETHEENKPNLYYSDRTHRTPVTVSQGFSSRTTTANVACYMVETIVRDRDEELSKNLDTGQQVDNGSKRTASTLNNEKPEEMKQKHMSIVQERVKELEQMLLSKKNATIDHKDNRVPRHSVQDLSQSKGKRLQDFHCPDSPVESNSRCGRNIVEGTTPDRSSQQVQLPGNTESRNKPRHGKDGRKRRSRDNPVRASTVFSTETLSNLVDMYSREMEKKTTENTFETETEKDIEECLIGKLKRNDSLPEVDLSNEVAVKRWKYKNRQRKLRESRILWDNEEAIRGIRGSVLKAHASMKILM